MLAQDMTESGRAAAVPQKSTAQHVNRYLPPKADIDTDRFRDPGPDAQGNRLPQNIIVRTRPVGETLLPTTSAVIARLVSNVVAMVSMNHQILPRPAIPPRWLRKGRRRDPILWGHRQGDQHHIQVLSAEAAVTIAKSEHNADQEQPLESDELCR